MERHDASASGLRAEILRRLDSGISLPALSPVALRLVELASDEACSASDLTEVIRKDPSLAVRLLKMANSAFYPSRQPVSTIEQAVVKVGFHRLRIMALSFALKDTFPMGKSGGLDYEGYWKSSLYRASIAKSLAQCTPTCDPEEAFLAGLILEIGLLALSHLAPTEEGEWPGDMEVPGLLAWEEKRYGINHRMIGEKVLRAWKFPEGILICQSIPPLRARENTAPPLVRTCEFARQLSENLLHRQKNLGGLYPPQEAWHGEWSHELINEALVNAFDQVQALAEQLKVRVNAEKDLLEIMEKANYALSSISERISNLGQRTPGGPLPTFDAIQGERGTVSNTLEAVAHEIRNPLLAVGGFAKRLASALDPSTEGGKYAHIIVEEASRLEKALSRMLAQEGKK